MYNIKHGLTAALIVAAMSMSACGDKVVEEPPLPVSDAQTHAKKGPEGYGVSGTVAIDAENNFYHMQRIVSDYYNYDVKQPPASISSVKASCHGQKADPEDSVHVIISQGGGAGGGLRGKEVPSLMLITEEAVEETAQGRADNFRKTGTYKPQIGRNNLKWPRSLGRQEIVVTETSRPVYVVLSTRWSTLYNFTLAPNVKISGVMVYTQEPYGAVAGLDPSVPVRFQSEKNPATKSCWVRQGNKPDSTWKSHKKAKRVSPGSRDQSRYHLLGKVYKKFAAKIKRDVGSYSSVDMIGANSASYYLIGPAPKTLEARIPYSPLGGSHITAVETAHVKFGMREDLNDYSRDMIHARTKQILGKGK